MWPSSRSEFEYTDFLPSSNNSEKVKEGKEGKEEIAGST